MPTVRKAQNRAKYEAAKAEDRRLAKIIRKKLACGPSCRLISLTNWCECQGWCL